MPAEYYRGEVKLPATDLRPWFMDLPSQLKIAFEKPARPNRHLQLCAAGKAGTLRLRFCHGVGSRRLVLEARNGLLLGLIAGFALGELVGSLIFKNRPYPPDIWHDYRMQAASWVNSLLVHAIALTLLLLPYILARMWQPVKAAPKVVAVDISPYLPLITPAGAKKAGGGGGGGDRSPTPASKGAIPKFAKVQLAPPMAVIPNLAPKLPGSADLAGAARIEAAANEFQHALGRSQRSGGSRLQRPGLWRRHWQRRRRRSGFWQGRWARSGRRRRLRRRSL